MIKRARRGDWKAMHDHELDFFGTEAECKRWAREREDARVIDPYGFVRWWTRGFRMVRM